MYSFFTSIVLKTKRLWCVVWERWRSSAQLSCTVHCVQCAVCSIQYTVRNGQRGEKVVCGVEVGLAGVPTVAGAGGRRRLTDVWFCKGGQDAVDRRPDKVVYSRVEVAADSWQCRNGDSRGGTEEMVTLGV